MEIIQKNFMEDCIGYYAMLNSNFFVTDQELTE